MANQINLKWGDGSCYSGDGVGETPNGKGLYVTASGEAFEGIWLNGFSFGSFKSWMEEELNNDKYNFITVFHAYFKSVDWFINESIGPVNRLNPALDVSFDVAMNFTYANRLRGHGEVLLNDFLSFVGNDFIEYSNSIYAGNRVYTCGGNYPFPCNFKDNLTEFMTSIEPIRKFLVCFSYLDSTIKSLEEFMETAIAGRRHELTKSFFRNALKQIK